MGWPKSGPSEFVEGKKSSLAGDIATTLPRRIASRYQQPFFYALESYSALRTQEPMLLMFLFSYKTLYGVGIYVGKKLFVLV